MSQSKSFHSARCSKCILILALSVLLLSLSACSTSTVVPTPTRPVLSKSLSDLECTHDRIGNAILTGRFTNTTDIVLRFIRIEGFICAEPCDQGPSLNGGWTYVDAETVRPGDSARYTIYIDDADHEMEYCRVRVLDFKW